MTDDEKDKANDEQIEEEMKLEDEEAAEPKIKLKGVQRDPVQKRLALKKKVRMFYDLQDLRMKTGGRIIPKKFKDEPPPPITLHEIDKQILTQRFNELKRAEKAAFSDVKEELKYIGFYSDILSDKKRFKGIGPTMAAVILSEFKIERADTVSKMWAFAGLAVKPAIRCKKCNILIDDKNGKLVHRKVADIKCSDTSETYASGERQSPIKGEQLPYNAFLRNKLCGVAGGCLLRCNSPWRSFYDNMKHRRNSQGWGISDGHRHRDAIRYMIKMLLLEIWKEWRKYENLSVRPSYQEQYLGHTHHEPQKESSPPLLSESVG